MQIKLQWGTTSYQSEWPPLKTPQIAVPIMAQWLTNSTSIHEYEGSIPDFNQWVKDLALPRPVV